jgi:hypothetical protein
MKKILYVIFCGAFLCAAIESNAQGCVAVRSFSGSSGIIGSEAFLPKGEFLAGSNFRYFRSYKHFGGKEEHTYRVEQGTEVINDSYFLDLSLTYGITDRLFGTFTLPMVYHERSSMYEHGGNPPNGLGDRHKTYAQGLGDIRFNFGYWVLNPHKHMNGNFSLGLGIKLPTGDFGAKDTFYNQGPERNQTLELTVDQSIQPGDGGLGVTFDFQGYRMLSHSLMLNGTLYYLANPRETNGESARNGGTEFSVPDQYAARVGVTYITSVPGLSVYLGARHECIPVYDLIGGSDGFRRPGYIISAEPGINYSWKKFALNVNVPIAMERNRTQSYLDKKNSTPDNRRHGDAAFADYLINVGFAWRLAKNTPDVFNVH